MLCAPLSYRRQGTNPQPRQPMGKQRLSLQVNGPPKKGGPLEQRRDNLPLPSSPYLLKMQAIRL